MGIGRPCRCASSQCTRVSLQNRIKAGGDRACGLWIWGTRPELSSASMWEVKLQEYCMLIAPQCVQDSRWTFGTPAEASAAPCDRVSAGGSGSLRPQRGDNVVIYNGRTASFCVTLGLSMKPRSVGKARLQYAARHIWCARHIHMIRLSGLDQHVAADGLRRVQYSPLGKVSSRSTSSLVYNRGSLLDTRGQAGRYSIGASSFSNGMARDRHRDWLLVYVPGLQGCSLQT